MKTNALHTSLDKQMDFLKSSLNSLIPILMEAKLVDADLVGYDGWDLISESLFKAIVEDTIRWSLPESKLSDFNLPKYGFELQSYQQTNFIKVSFKNGAERNKAFAFVGFGPGQNGAIEFAKVFEIGEKGRVIASSVIPCGEATYSCQIYVNGKVESLTELVVQN
jgi:hypothetical protein